MTKNKTLASQTTLQTDFVIPNEREGSIQTSPRSGSFILYFKPLVCEILFHMANT